MIKVIVIGCGSIGQRHIRALLKLDKDLPIAAYRTKKGHYKDLPEDISSHIVEFDNIKKALDWNPTHMIISNPTSLHAKFIDIGITAGCKIFVEKPLIQDLSEINKMETPLKVIQEHSGMVGFNLRFHGVIRKVKEIIDSKKFGEIMYSSISVGHYLPLWHPYEDYRKGYYARKDLGGGVLRTLSHELDLIQFFFGKLLNLTAKTDKISKLEIDVEDCVDIIMEAESCKRVILHMDYLNPLPLRQGRLIFEEGLLEYDFFKGEIHFTDYECQKRIQIYKNSEDFDQQYIEQMKHFIKDKKSSVASKIKDSIIIMKIINKCEESDGNLEIL